MRTEVLKTIRKYNMPVAGRRVIVALSGGSDSMALLHLMNSLRNELGFTLEAAHVNHNLRGENAVRDERFAAAQCEKLGIECHVLSVDVNALAGKEGMSVEQAGRKARYDFFASLGEDTVTATAHNLNDRIETMLFNLARGSSLRGLCSIPPVRGNIIRPLISCSKEQIISYCEQNGIPFVTDETNSDTKYSRNRIRLNVLPELKKLNPAFEECAGRCINSLNEDEEYLYGIAAAAVESAKQQGGYGIAALCGNPAPVLRRAVDIIVKLETGVAPEGLAIEEIICALRDYLACGMGRNIQLPLGLALRTRAGLLEVPGEKQAPPDEIPLREGVTSFGGFTVEARRVKSKNNSQTVQENVCVYVLDCDKITGGLIIRTRRDGDVISPAGRGVTKPLRKLQNENGVPPEIRGSAPVIADEKGIAAAYMCGVDERVRTGAGSGNLLEITVTRGVD